VRGVKAGTGIGRIVLAHGGGGELMQQLIRERVLRHLGNETLDPLDDGAVIPWPADRLVLTTDSYVVTPVEFPGGDIGRLAVAGTVNDLAVMGAQPVALSLGLILEEGLDLTLLDRVLASIAATAEEAGVRVATGDTKVVERRSGSGEAGLFVNTAGVGRLRDGARLELGRVEPGDAILINGRLAEHGLAVLSARGDIGFETDLRSDVAPLHELIGRLLSSGADVKFLRDPTRGGVAGVLADVVSGRGLSLEVDEEALPISPTARHAAEMIGLDPLGVANEGKVVCVVAGRDAGLALEAMRAHPLGKRAAMIGRVTDSRPPLVELITRAGGRRIVQRPYGEDLPRIC
jgi:hydrogenase expression/formation protein HypE